MRKNIWLWSQARSSSSHALKIRPDEIASQEIRGERRSLLDGEPELLPRSRPPMPLSGLAASLTAPASQRRPTGDHADPSLPGAGHKSRIDSKFELEVHKGELSRSRAIWSSAQAGRQRRYLRYLSEWLRWLRLGVRSRRRRRAC